MALVSGPLSTVTTTPSAVAQVNVSISSPRTRGLGVMTPEVKTVAVTGGDFSSQIAPGPAVLTLLIGGRESAPIPILVDDVESQTLADVVNAARLASGETQESLAALVQQVLSARSDVLDAVAGFGQVEEDALTAIGDASAGALAGIGDARSGALSAISDARGGALTDIGQATSSAIVDIGTAESGALSEIGVEVGKAEDAAVRAENAVNDGLGDGAVTLQKLAPDVKAQINSKADLVGGKVPTSQIPEVALTKPFSVASRAALLALTAQEGDIGIITAGADKGSYMLGTGPSNVFSSWVQLAVSADAPVSSVNGQTGTVVLNAANVGAAPTSHTHTASQITGLPTTDGGYNTRNATDPPTSYPTGVSTSLNDGTIKGWQAAIGAASMPSLGQFVVVTTIRQALYTDSTWQYLHSYSLPGAPILVRKWQGEAWTTLRRLTDDGHTHTSAQISDRVAGVWSNSVEDGRVIATSGGGFIQTSKLATENDHVANKRYVDTRTPPPVRQEVTGTNGVTIFEKRGNVVHVASAGTNAGVTIPTDFRPTQVRRVAVSTGGAATNVGSCTLNPDGTITGGWGAGSAFSYLAQ